MDLRYKNYPSKYELQYVKWNGINFDRERLIKFVKRLKLTRFLSFIPSFKEEHTILNEIFTSYDDKIIKGLLENDENISRICFIEKWARIASVDILLTNVYSRLTFTTISNLPVSDYQLLTKRIEELISLAQNFTTQKDKITDNIPST